MIQTSTITAMPTTLTTTRTTTLEKSVMKGPPRIGSSSNNKYDKRRKPIFSLGRRMGRKGDPRMHRAVMAKLADPNMSLFHALKAGGFNYIDDIDAKAVDEESVTLAQRKNQLSRRLRMAKNTDSEPEDRSQKTSSPPTSQQTLEDLVEAQKATFQSLLQQSTEGSSIGSVDSHNFSEHFNTGEHHEHDVSMMEPLHHHAHMHSHHEDHHDQKMGPVASFVSLHHPEHNDHAMMGRNGSDMPPSHVPLPPPPPMMQRGDGGVPDPLPEPPRLLSRISSRTVNNDTGIPVCSEFGLRSLNRTAQAMGLSLDELALVLSSTENLAEKLGISQDNDGPVGV